MIHATPGKQMLFNIRVGRLLALTLAAITLSACDVGDSAGDSSRFGNLSSTECNATTQKDWAYDAMRDFYLFADQVPVVDPQSFDSANDVVRSVRFAERDDFSNVSNAIQSSMLFDEGRSFGLGYRSAIDSAGNSRIALTYNDSPFGRAGVERGDRLVSVDGIAWEDQQLDSNWTARVIGTVDNPATATWEFEKRDSNELVEIDITAAEYSINSVLQYDTLSLDAVPSGVGYLAFNIFLDTSIEELNEAFAHFNDENISELVLDLRYNGGGRVVVARHLASLISDSSEAGDTIYEYRYNDRYEAFNYDLTFIDGLATLDLNRVIILTTNSTASSSEIVLAGLQPHLEVVTIGSTSRGKPYVSGAIDRCDERLNIIQAEGFNANGISVFGGVEATCYAEDDITRNFGIADNDEVEGFLQAGLDYIETGVCATAPTTVAQQSADRQSDERQTDNSRTSSEIPFYELAF